MLRHLVVVAAVIIVLALAGFFAFVNLGSEFTPELEEGTMVLRLTMAPSISLNESRRVTMALEKRLMAIPEVVSVVSRIGRGEVGAHTDPINSAEMYIGLKPHTQWRGRWTQEELETAIRNDLGDIPGVLTNFTQPIAMTVDELLEGIRAELAVKLHGEDLPVLADKAQEIAAVLRSIRGAEDVQVEQIAGAPQLRIDIDREAIARYGLNVADVQETVRTAIGGAPAGEIFEGVRRFPIVVRFPEEWRDTPEVIGRLTLPAPQGARVLLADVANIQEIIGPRQIMREDGQRFITVQCNVSGRDIGGFVEEAGAALRDRVPLGEGYSITWGGQFRLQQEANARFALVIPITLLLIFVLLYSSLNDLRRTVLILLNIPLALVGGAVALWITGQNLSVPASIGFISLFGIAIGNGLVLVSAIRQQEKESGDLSQAIIRGSLQRLRPVMMTALTTALGLLPLLFASGTGSEVQRPLATVVIGGLVTATSMTLLVVPALYGLFMRRAGTTETHANV
jgi:cobalt-zinc-cadmium resistance protein CzcA